MLPARGLLDEAELQSLVDQRLLDLGEKFFALVRGAESEPMLSIVRVTGRSHTTELDLRALEN